MTSTRSGFGKTSSRRSPICTARSKNRAEIEIELGATSAAGSSFKQNNQTMKLRMTID